MPYIYIYIYIYIHIYIESVQVQIHLNKWTRAQNIWALGCYQLNFPNPLQIGSSHAKNWVWISKNEWVFEIWKFYETEILEKQGSYFRFSLILIYSKNHVLQLRFYKQFFNHLIVYTHLAPWGCRVEILIKFFSQNSRYFYTIYRVSFGNWAKVWVNCFGNKQ